MRIRKIPSVFDKGLICRSMTASCLFSLHVELGFRLIIIRGLIKSNNTISALCLSSSKYQKNKTYSQFTWFTGLPSRKAAILSLVIFIILILASLLIQALCGVMIQFFATSKGLFSPGGSVDKTSNAAPAI
jgi:hypothetical protein